MVGDCLHCDSWTFSCRQVHHCTSRDKIIYLAILQHFILARWEGLTLVRLCGCALDDSQGDEP
jgi:hypothetical protein